MIKNIVKPCLLTLLLISNVSIYAKEFYKWVDANGSTHYTDTPPPKSTKQTKVHTYGWNNSNPTQTTAPSAPATLPIEVRTQSGRIDVEQAVKANEHSHASSEPVGISPKEQKH